MTPLLLEYIVDGVGHNSIRW